jgi:hypothetical protein
MREVVSVAISATLGNLLFGWDSSTIAGVFYSLMISLLLSNCVYYDISYNLLQSYYEKSNRIFDENQRRKNKTCFGLGQGQFRQDFHTKGLMLHT